MTLHDAADKDHRLNIQAMMRLALLGYTPRAIAQDLGRSLVEVRGVMRSPLFQAELERRRALGASNPPNSDTPSLPNYGRKP